MSRSVRASGLALLGVVAAMALACVPSLHSLYTSKDVVFDDALLGTWTDSSSNEQWVFSRGGPSAYHLVYTDEKGRAGAFTVHLVQLGKDRFLDFYPDSAAAPANEFLAIHFVPAHTFAIVDAIRPRLRLGLMEEKAIETYATAHPGRMPYAVTDHGGLLLTASTAELQTYMRLHAHDPKVFGDRSSLIPQG